MRIPVRGVSRRVFEYRVSVRIVPLAVVGHLRETEAWSEGMALQGQISQQAPKTEQMLLPRRVHQRRYRPNDAAQRKADGTEMR